MRHEEVVGSSDTECRVPIPKMTNTSISPAWSVGALIVIAIAATGILLMRFRKRWLATINIVVTNRIASLFASSRAGCRDSAFSRT